MWWTKRRCRSSFSFALSLAFSTAGAVGLCTHAFAAACCGGGFAAPALIAGDDRAQATLSTAFTDIRRDVGADGIWRPRAVPETSFTTKAEAAHIFSDRWQAGAALPLLHRRRAEQGSTGLGDATLNLGYEFLPDWDYHPWRPKGLGYLQLTLPTGRSVHEARHRLQLDSRGRGFWAVGAGTLLTKSWGALDAFFQAEAHRAFSRTLASGTQLKPGWGGTAGGGLGASMGDFRLGVASLWTYEQPLDTRNPEQAGALQRFATVTASVHYLASPEWAFTLAYSDQLFLGQPHNTSLARGAGFTVQRRWAR